MEDRPNLTREDVLPPDSCQCSKTFKTSLNSIRDMTFTWKGVFGLHIDIGEDLVSKLFRKASVPTKEIMCETAFIYEHIQRIETSWRFLVPRRENPTPVLASLSNDVLSHLGEEQKENFKRHVYTVEPAETTPSRSQAAVLMTREGLDVGTPISWTNVN